MKRQGLSFKDSDLLNLHIIICIVDNQPEIDSKNPSLGLCIKWPHPGETF